MARVILDMGSGNTCHNELKIARKMMDAVKKIDTGKHEIIFKMQLFRSAPPNAPLSHQVFRGIYDYGNKIGYNVTASVFDPHSLNYLLSFDPCFVKIACRPDLYWLAEEVPRRIPVYVSYDATSKIRRMDLWTQPVDSENSITKLLCVPKYPADISDYTIRNYPFISDHTVGLDLWHQFHPEIWEKHLKLPDSTGPDAGSFAITPDELKEIL